MKILIATAYDYPHAGGLSTHVATLKAGLEERGHEVDVLSFSDISPAVRKVYAQGPSFVIQKLKKGRGILWSHHARKKLIQKLIEKNKHKQYDLINAQDPFTTLAAIETGIPTVSTVHGYMAFESVSKGSIIEGSPEAKEMQDIEIKAYKGTRKIITVDQRLKDYVKEMSGVEGNAIRNFIDIHSFKPDKDKKGQLRDQYGVSRDEHVLFVPRRLTKKNGVIYPALALPAVLEKYPNTRLIYAGSGEALNEIKQIVAENKMEDRVTLLGAVPHEKVKDYYALADIVLVPSVHSAGVEEATSISALEAMGSGSPLVACAVGGLKEIVDPGKDGLLVEEKNVEELSEAILYFLENPEKGEEMAKNAREKIEKEYSHLAAAAKYEEIYLSALKK
ncbi:MULTISPECIES: glycosyltransferase family 4 protein [Bacillus]|uniref:Glycosyltransferase family 4 protein n=1 Tax=Bacillus infantis TaxID=324767 RepID=A0A5D4RAI2_9BACI|nr:MULTISPECIES: glycosyltransferase family 4 protein [Bacillus]MDT0161578.1 glycosyltransferase family 4 protein [Bacillus sp. AG4(2022)]TYS47034.1 glycosyltransferase family 4 protein [Bacillus infantis]